MEHKFVKLYLEKFRETEFNSGHNTNSNGREKKKMKSHVITW